MYIFFNLLSIIYKLIKKTNISKNDFVIEIGPGKGHITEALCEKSYWVTAIELVPAGDTDQWLPAVFRDVPRALQSPFPSEIGRAHV